ncbi:MAG: hypothetical protein SGBAC_003339 [Bacillariaceae sp.]
MTIGSLPHLPLVCLKSADFSDTQEVVKGKNTIIDFWTTKCTRCPDALDKLDHMAQDPKYENVQFVSICCDKLDGARDIIDQEEEERWQNVNHYFMESKDKETAKKVLGFRQVPFYVVLDEHGDIQQMGNHRAIDFDEVPGVVRPEPSVSSAEEEKENFDQVDMEFDDVDFALDFANRIKLESYVPFQPPPVHVERVFAIDDDF